MDGRVFNQKICYVSSAFVRGFPYETAGTNENQSEPSTLRLRSFYPLPVHPCLFISTGCFYSGYFISRVLFSLLGTTAGIGYGFVF